MQATDTATELDDGAPDGPRAAVDVDIVIPVYNEERILARSVLRLHRFLSQELPYSWRITIADNASSDSTLDIARALADDLEEVELVRVEQQGRGRALRAAWTRSDARVVAYMDADLSTDLRAVLPLVAPLLSGHSEIAIGSRLHRGAKVDRSLKRELISRIYNRLLHGILHARFSDAQCGFKAVRADMVPDLLAAIQDEAWFFDTELLVVAQRRRLRIHEVPVDWVEDSDSSVRIIPTAWADLRGIARLLRHPPCNGRRPPRPLRSLPS
jgi:glycosyltransferase involved in cell wall biosynthesis